jgi:hypothetical protein
MQHQALLKACSGRVTEIESRKKLHSAFLVEALAMGSAGTYTSINNLFNMREKARRKCYSART